MIFSLIEGKDRDALSTRLLIDLSLSDKDSV